MSTTTPNKAEDFLTSTQEKSIIEAIYKAESKTSGEICIHIEGEKTSDLDEPERAHKAFFDLQLNETENRNAVLIHISVEEKSFSIIGDKGIHDLVGDNFWKTECQILSEAFKNKEFCKGIIEVVGQIGEKLSEFFPYQENDKNELPNEITKS